MTVGFKRHLSAYTGDCCRIRRSSDNAERDIPFDSDGIVDVRKMRSFAVNSDIYLVTFYDQSGNALKLQILDVQGNRAGKVIFEKAIMRIQKIPNPPKELLKNGRFRIYFTWIIH